jgi:hypothetical protein
MTANSVRINVCKITNQKDAKIIVVNRSSWNTFLQQASNKLRIKAKRVFTQHGEEITAQDFENPKKIKDDMLLIITSGTEFIGNTKVHLSFLIFSLLLLRFSHMFLFIKSNIPKPSDQIIGLSEEQKESLNNEEYENHSECVVRIISHGNLNI